MCSKTLILALIREIQASIPRKKTIKAVICTVLTQWTMHYQSYWRLRELCVILVIIVEANKDRLYLDHCVVTGDTKARAKATQMVQLIWNLPFWGTLTIYMMAKKLL